MTRRALFGLVGAAFLPKTKASAITSDTPYVIVTEEMTKAECARRYPPQDEVVHITEDWFQVKGGAFVVFRATLGDAIPVYWSEWRTSWPFVCLRRYETKHAMALTLARDVYGTDRMTFFPLPSANDATLRAEPV